MMLVQLPAMDAAANALSLPSFAGVVPSSLSSSLSTVTHSLARPSLWLVLLASLVILSTIRAVLLYVRPPPSTAHKSCLSIVQLSHTTTTTTTEGTARIEKAEKAILSTTPASATTPATADKLAAPSPPADSPKQATTSWFWGLVKWDSLPALPVSWTAARGLSMSETERGRWRSPHLQQMRQQQQGRRPGPAFEHPLPALYESEIPVSMAKMIMSRHTFRRPTSRPPPVRNANAPQYQRRPPSMV